MNNDILFPLLLSIRIALIATIIASIIGIVFAKYMARKNGIFPTILDAFCTLPLVLPPTVLGYYLILALGKKGYIGSWLYSAGIQVMFTWQGATIACTVVVFPLVYKYARTAFSQVDTTLELSAKTLGASEFRVFLTISLPLAFKGILVGILLAFARGLGEFGATLMIAGNIPYKTQTLSLAIYDAFQTGNDARAVFLVLITSGICIGILCIAELLLGKKKYL